MIDVVTPELRPMYAGQLEQMFRQRYEIFVEKLGWDLPAKGCVERLEKDQFDTPGTVYLILSEDGESVQGATRMNPTTGPHMMRDLFRDLCDGPAPRGRHVWEGSRTYASLTNTSTEEQIRTFMLGAIGMIEFGLLFGVESILSQNDAADFPNFSKRGFNCSMLGSPKTFSDGKEYCAITIDVDPPSLRRLREMYGIVDPLIRVPRLRHAA